MATLKLARERRPYQADGVAWLKDGKRRFLTDGFGLGKTSQAVWASEGSWPVLVAAPVHLLNHWRREIIACYPEARVKVALAQGLAGRQKALEGDADFYVVNIELLRSGMAGWFAPLATTGGAVLSDGTVVPGKCAIKTFIVDEAHRLRGRSSAQTMGALAVARLVENVFLLTATPVYNTPADLYSQLRLLDPVRFKSYWAFETLFLAVQQTAWGPRTMGLARDKKLLGVFKEYALGRTRQEVQAQLPALQQSLLEVEPPREWYAAYEVMKNTYKIEYDGSVTSRQSILQKLRAYTQQPKLQAVCTLIADNNCHEHTLIYTYHRDLAYAVGSLLGAPVITGDMAPAKREEVARGHDFVVATFPSVAEGLNLSHMQNVIFMEHDWQAGMLDQALNRVHRPGNLHESTNVYHIVVKRTVDSILYNVVRKRGATMEEVIQAALVPWAMVEAALADEDAA